MQHFVFEIHIFRGGLNHAPVVPFDKSDAARIQTVSSQIHPFGWNDVRNAPVASVAEEQHKTFRVRIDGKMISREAAQTDGARAHPLR